MKAFVVFIDLFSILTVAMFAIFTVSSGEDGSPRRDSGYLAAELKVYWPAEVEKELGGDVLATALRFSATVVNESSETPAILPSRKPNYIIESRNRIIAIAWDLPRTQVIRFSLRSTISEVVGKKVEILVRRNYPSPSSEKYDAVIGSWPDFAVGELDIRSSTD